MARFRQPPLPDIVSSKFIDKNEILILAQSVSSLGITDIEQFQKRLPDAETLAKIPSYRQAIYANSRSYVLRTQLSTIFDKLLRSNGADMMEMYTETESNGQVNFLKFNPKNKSKGTVVAHTTLHNLVGALSPIVENGMQNLIKAILEDEDSASKQGHFPCLGFFGTCAYVTGLRTPAIWCAMKLGAHGTVGHTAAWLVAGKNKGRVTNNEGRIIVDGSPVPTMYVKKPSRESVSFTDDSSSFHFDYESVGHVATAKPKPQRTEGPAAQSSAPKVQKPKPSLPPIVEPSRQLASDSDEAEIEL